MGWGGVRWGGLWWVKSQAFFLCPAEALECWAAGARVDAWRLGQDKKVHLTLFATICFSCERFALVAKALVALVANDLLNTYTL